MIARLASARGLFGLSLLFIVYATTLPFDFSRAPSLEGANLVPLWDEARHRLHSVPDMVQNVVLFAPFGFFLALGWGRGPAVTGVAGLLCSLLVESLQTMTTVRQPSTTDLVTNATGAALGGVAAALWRARLAAPAAAALRRLLALQPGLAIVAGLAAIVLFVGLAPFVPTLDVGALRGQVRALLDHPWGERPLGASLPEAVLFSGLGFATAHELPARLGLRGTAARAIAGGAAVAGLALALELLQLPMRFHRPAGADVLANALGGMLGAAMVVALHRGRAFEPDRALGAWTRRWPAAVLGFAVLAPVTRALSPFVLRGLEAGLEATSAAHLVPFGLLFEGLRVSTFLNVFEAAATYLPLGYALATLGVRPLVGLGLSVGLAEALEIAQLFVEGRTTDVTEGLFAVAGAVAGWRIAALVAPIAQAPAVGESARG